MKITVAGTGYVGLSIAILLSQHHQVTAVDIVPEKIDLIKKRLPEHSERRFLIAEIFHFLLYIKDNFSFLRCGLLFPSILI